MTPRTVLHQAPVSVEFPRQKYGRGLPFPSPGDLPNSGIKPTPPAWQVGSLQRSTWEASTTDIRGQIILGFRKLSYALQASQVVLVVKHPPANAGDLRDMGSIPGSGRSPGEGNGNPLQNFCLENPDGQRCLVGYSP